MLDVSEQRDRDRGGAPGGQEHPGGGARLRPGLHVGADAGPDDHRAHPRRGLRRPSRGPPRGAAPLAAERETLRGPDGKEQGTDGGGIRRGTGEMVPVLEEFQLNGGVFSGADLAQNVRREAAAHGRAPLLLPAHP